jgi:hypothetical protein
MKEGFILTKAEWFSKGLSINFFLLEYVIDNSFYIQRKDCRAVLADNEEQAKFNLIGLLQEKERKAGRVLNYIDISITKTLLTHAEMWSCYADDEELDIPVYPEAIKVNDLEKALHFLTRIREVLS